MRTAAPPMIPLFRSDGQAQLLAVLFDRARQPLTIRQLAHLTDIPLPTVHREITRLAHHGMVNVSTVGRTRLVEANWDLPWAHALAELVAQTVGLPAVIGSALTAVPGVEAAHIFGSWAARYHGETGPPPGDIDVLVIGDVDLDRVRVALKPAEKTAGVYINATATTSAQWTDASDAFASTVRDRPSVPVPLPLDGPVALPA
jgi:hypothetical protein